MNAVRACLPTSTAGLTWRVMALRVIREARAHVEPEGRFRDGLATIDVPPPGARRPLDRARHDAFPEMNRQGALTNVSSPKMT